MWELVERDSFQYVVKHGKFRDLKISYTESLIFSLDNLSTVYDLFFS